MVLNIFCKEKALKKKMYVRLAYLGLPPAVSHLSKTSVVKLCIKSVPTSTEDQHTDYGSVFFLSMDKNNTLLPGRDTCMAGLILG